MNMDKKTIIIVFTILVASFSLLGISKVLKKEEPQKTKTLEATVMSVDDGKISVQDKDHVIYTFKSEVNAKLGDNIILEYSGVVNKNKCLQKTKLVDYETSEVTYDENGIPTTWLDDGIFKQFYILAFNKLKELSLDEKIAQLLLVQYPDANAEEILKKYQFGGYLFFEKNFKDKTENEVKTMMNNLQNISKVPILTAVDEEGGEKVRVSSNTNLVKERFKSPSELYKSGGLEEIRRDTIEKSKVLNNLGLNLNLAPVVDVSTSDEDYIHKRSLGEDTKTTSEYAKTVIEASKNTGVSYTLKHFPGYGNNEDTHTGSSKDDRNYDSILEKDIPPFEAGIDVGAEAVLVSHNTVTNIDSNNPASLSPTVHNLLRNRLKFTGVIITDDLSMKATSSIKDKVVKALLAGNDIVIVSDYEDSIEQIKNSLENNTLSEELIDKLAFRVLAWKYYKGLMFEVHK